MRLPRDRLISNKILSTIEGFLSNKISLGWAVQRTGLPVEDLSVEKANPAIAVDIRNVMSFQPLSTDLEIAQP